MNERKRIYKKNIFCLHSIETRFHVSHKTLAHRTYTQQRCQAGTVSEQFTKQTSFRPEIKLKHRIHRYSNFLSSSHAHLCKKKKNNALSSILLFLFPKTSLEQFFVKISERAAQKLGLKLLEICKFIDSLLL